MGVIGDITIKLSADASDVIRAIAGMRGAVSGVMQFFQSTLGTEVLRKGIEFTKDMILDTVGASLKFQEQMRNINTIAKLSDTELGTLGKELDDLAVSFGASASDLQKAYYDIYSSGFQGAAAMDLLKSATIAAKASLSTTAEATKGIAAVLNAYGMSGEYAADVSDVMFKTVENGVITFAELAGNLGDVVSTASAAGVAFPEIAAAIATMTKGGISGAEAVTSINAALARFLSGSDELNALFKDFGGSAQAIGKIGLAGAMEKITLATGGSAKKIQDLGFQIRDFKAVASLARNEGRAFAEDLAAVATSSGRAGAAQKSFNEQQKSNLFIISQIRAAWESMGLTIGGSVEQTEGFRSSLEFARDSILTINELFASSGEAVSGIFNSMLAVIPEISAAFLDVYKVVDSIYNSVSAIVNSAMVLASTPLSIFSDTAAAVRDATAQQVLTDIAQVRNAFSSLGTESNQQVAQLLQRIRGARDEGKQKQATQEVKRITDSAGVLASKGVQGVVAPSQTGTGAAEVGSAEAYKLMVQGTEQVSLQRTMASLLKDISTGTTEQTTVLRMLIDMRGSGKISEKQYYMAREQMQGLTP